MSHQLVEEVTEPHLELHGKHLIREVKGDNKGKGEEVMVKVDMGVDPPSCFTPKEEFIAHVKGHEEEVEEVCLIGED